MGDDAAWFRRRWLCRVSPKERSQVPAGLISSSSNADYGKPPRGGFSLARDPLQSHPGAKSADRYFVRTNPTFREVGHRRLVYSLSSDKASISPKRPPPRAAFC